MMGVIEMYGNIDISKYQMLLSRLKIRKPDVFPKRKDKGKGLGTEKVLQLVCHKKRRCCLYLAQNVIDKFHQLNIKHTLCKPFDILDQPCKDSRLWWNNLW
eukprot:TRINITY_DN5653_c0_g1_i2.p1 TRINITY_DN5653_c0_g1~~TRINITY_DN5653_c0_g1_i2.p1  ORF type:complete len:101 (-),score=15.22 TRINITY_DN5653_c0_g1_i2:780-1082(-)